MAGPNGLSQAVVQNTWETLKGPLSHLRPSGGSSRLSGGFSWHEENPARPPHDQAGGSRFRDTPGSARFRSLQAQIPTHFLPLIWDLAWGEILSLKWSPGLPGPGAAPASLWPPGTQRNFHTASLPGHPSFASLLPAPPRPLSRTSPRVIPLPEGGLRRLTPELASRSSSLGSKRNCPNTCTWAPLT